MSKKIRNIFISHVHEDDAGLSKLKDMLGKKGYEIRDGSINADKPNNAKSPDYIWNEILRPRIEWAGAMIVYVSPKTKDSEWVNREIEHAAKEGKRIVGVWAHGEAKCDVPNALDKYADAVVGWNADAVADALEGKVNNWCNQDGSIRNDRPIPRYSC